MLMRGGAVLPWYADAVRPSWRSPYRSVALTCGGYWHVTLPNMHIDSERLSRAQGCLLGQLAGDSLGSLVEFKSSQEIRRKYPSGIRELEDGGTWGTIAGQPTDDSEMALALARMLIERRRYAAEEARK